jgi:hypothetical protein
MYVDIGGTRELVMHDVRNGRDVESTSGDVGREKDRRRRGFEAASEGARRERASEGLSEARRRGTKRTDRETSSVHVVAYRSGVERR